MSSFCADPRVCTLLSKGPVRCDRRSQSQVQIFRRLLEIAWSKGRWNGRVAEVS